MRGQTRPEADAIRQMSASPQRPLSGRLVPQPILFHIRHFGVGGIEAALMGWLKGLDRTRFAPALSIFLPTREWQQVYQSRVPADVPVHFVLPENGALVRWHQKRRDGQLGKLGRLQLGLALQTVGRRALRSYVQHLQSRYPVIIDFDHSLRKLVPALKVPVLAVRHFAFWDEVSAKAKRVGRDLAAYDRVLVLNEDMRQQAQHLYGASSAQAPHCVVMPNLFDLPGMAREAQERLPVPELAGQPYVVCVARLDIPTKGLDTLVRAWQHVVAGEPDARLLIVGDGHDREELQQLVEAAGLSEQVHLVGMQANPYPWIANARLLVSASRSEGASNVLIEALALKTPVVATDCPVGASDTLEGGRCGALVPVDDAPALAAALLRGWRDAQWRDAMRQEGLRRAQYFSCQQGSERLAGVVADVLAERQRGGAGTKSRLRP